MLYLLFKTKNFFLIEVLRRLITSICFYINNFDNLKELDFEKAYTNVMIYSCYSHVLIIVMGLELTFIPET